MLAIELDRIWDILFSPWCNCRDSSIALLMTKETLAAFMALDELLDSKALTGWSFPLLALIVANSI